MTESLPLPLETALSAAWPPDRWCDVTVLAAVSGGPDSVALLRGLAALKQAVGGKGRLAAAHLNHHLRPEAEADARWVAGLGASLGVEVIVGSVGVAERSAARGDGIEAAAREARYVFLQNAAERIGARYVATGHTADDQVETILFNVLRGTGLAGLGGMRRARPLGEAVTLIRPLLGVRRREVAAYLDELKQPYLTDPTNVSRDFTRNRIRHELLPLVREHYSPGVDDSLIRLGQMACEVQQTIGRLADELLDGCLVEAGEGPKSTVRIRVAELARADRHLVREMFVRLWQRRNWPAQQMSFGHWDKLAELALGADAVHTMPGNIVAERRGGALTISERQRPRG